MHGVLGSGGDVTTMHVQAAAFFILCPSEASSEQLLLSFRCFRPFRFRRSAMFVDSAHVSAGHVGDSLRSIAESVCRCTIAYTLSGQADAM